MDEVGYDVVGHEGGATWARVTLRGPRRNALGTALLDALGQALDRAVSDGVRAVVLAADGPAFCSGMDLDEALRDGVAGSSRVLARVLRQIVALPVPVVARVHGAARAGGLGLVAACDVALCADDVTFAFTEARLGLAPSVISLTVLPRLSPRAASHRYLAGSTFSAAEAASAGLVTAAVADLDGAVDDVLADLLAGHPQGLAATKRVLNAGLLARFDAEVDGLVDLSTGLFASDPAREAIAALLNRPRP